MKTSLTNLLLIMTTTLLCQTYQIAPDSLIKKFRVSKISAFLLDSAKKETLHSIRQYDSLGNLIFYSIFDHGYISWGDNDDPGPSNSINMYTYQNKILKKETHFRSGSDNQTDTSFFSYDGKNRLKEKTTKKYYWERNGYQLICTDTIQFQYYFDTILIANEKSTDWSRGRISRINISKDTLFYGHNNLLLFKIRQPSNIKTTYHYNDKNQLVSKTTTSPNPSSLIAKESFIYKDGLLIREELLLYTRDGKYRDSRSMDYINNANGLLEVYRLGPLNSIMYKYDYY
jgi:hypothetical protein